MMDSLITETQKLELKDDHVAIVFTPDSMRVVSPKRDDDEDTPAHVYFACAISYLCVHDPDFVTQVMDRFSVELDNMETH